MSVFDSPCTPERYSPSSHVLLFLLSWFEMNFLPIMLKYFYTTMFILFACP